MRGKLITNDLICLCPEDIALGKGDFQYHWKLDAVAASASSELK